MRGMLYTIVIGMMLLIFTYPTYASIPYTIRNYSVIFDDSNVYISITPHTMKESGYFDSSGQKMPSLKIR